MIIRRILNGAVQVVLSGGSIWQAMAGVAVCGAICVAVAVMRSPWGKRAN